MGNLRLYAVKDNAEGQLSAGISAAVLSFSLNGGEGANFPTTYNGTCTSAGTSQTLNSTGIGATGVSVGDIIENITDGSIAIITAVAANSVTTTVLKGGTGNDWGNSDKWHVNRFVITFNKRDGNGAITASEKVLINSRSGDTFTIQTGTRGFDGSTPQTFDSSDYVNLFPTNSVVQGIRDFAGQLAQDIQDTRDTYATIAYVTTLFNARNWKDPVVVATDAAGTLASDFEDGDTVDGEVLATDDRILIKDQADAKENGIYIVTSGAPTRADDFDEDAELTAAVVPVEKGTANEDTIWILTTDDPEIGVDNLLFQSISSGLSAAEAAILAGGVNSFADTLHTHKLCKLLLGQTTDVTVNDTAIETDLVNISVPANTLATSNAVKVKIWISDYDTEAGGDTHTFRFKYGGTTVATIIKGGGNALTNRKGFIEAILIAAGATNAQEGNIYGELFEDTDQPDDAKTGFKMLAFGTSAEDSTGALDFKVTVQGAAGAGNNVVAAHAVVEIIQKP